MISARYGHGAVTCQGSAFVIGGTNGKADLDSIEKYDNFTNSWQEMSPLIERVCMPSVCSFGSKIYVFGGQEEQDKPAKVQIYETRTNEWSIGSRLRSPSNPIAACSNGGNIWVLGKHERKRAQA